MFSRRLCGDVCTVIRPAATALSICWLTVPFGKIGVKNKDLTWVNYGKVADRTPEQRQHLLRATEQRFAKLTAATPAAAPSPSPAPAAPRSR